MWKKRVKNDKNVIWVLNMCCKKLIKYAKETNNKKTLERLSILKNKIFLVKKVDLKIK